MSSKISLAYYQNILFDFDGVLLDTNAVKRRNIMATVSQYCSQEKARAFTGWETYFRAKPGVRIAKNLCDLDCGIPAADGLVREVRITPQSS